MNNETRLKYDNNYLHANELEIFFLIQIDISLVQSCIKSDYIVNLLFPIFTLRCRFTSIYFANYLRACFNSFKLCIVFLLLVFRDG